MRNALEIIKEQMQALVQKTANMLKALKEKLFKKWSKVTEYLKTKSTDTWQNVDKMFEQLDKETFGSTALNFTHATGKKQTCVVLPLAARAAHNPAGAPSSGFSAGICPSSSDQMIPTFALTSQEKTF